MEVNKKKLTLDISGNYLSDLSSLSGLNQLLELNFARNQVTTLPTWVAGCTLVRIDGSNNQISDISMLGNLADLNYVLMDYNSISSVDALASCHNLIKVSVYGNPVKDVSVLTEMNIIVNYNPL